MEIDFKALAAGLGAAALMAFGAHAHPHQQAPDAESQAAPAAKEAAKAHQADGTRDAPAAASAAAR